MKILTLFTMILLSSSCLSQIKDTVYIYFDSTLVGMKKVSYKMFNSKKYPDENIKASYKYFIDKKKNENKYLYDTGYTFTHFNQGKSEYETFGGVPPLKIIKDSCFIKKKKPLNIDFFLTTDYFKVCKTFEKEDNWEQDVIIFIIDKDEIKDGKLILREVTFSRPAKE